MTSPAAADASDDLTVARVLASTESWGITVTEADVRAALERFRDEERRFSPEVARHRVWAIFPEPCRPLVIDLTVAEQQVAP